MSARPPFAALLAAVFVSPAFAQDAAVPPAADPPPAPADRPAATNTDGEPGYEKADDRGTLRLPPTGGERRTADRAEPDEVEAQITELTNAFRKTQGLNPVEADEALAKAAAKFGAYLAKEGVLGHRAGGTTPAERVKAVGYDYCAVRENLAYQFDTFGFSSDGLAKACVDGWIKSPGHRANLVAEDVTETGVGIVYDAKSGRYFAVQLFGLPASASVSFEVENRTADVQTYRVGDQSFSLPPRYVQGHTRCTPGAVAVRLGPVPKVEDGANGEAPREDAKPLEVKNGQVLILRPADGGGVSPEVWTPPEEGAAPGKPAAGRR